MSRPNAGLAVGVGAVMVGAAAVATSIATLEESTHVDIWSSSWIWVGVSLTTLGLAVTLFFIITWSNRAPELAVLQYYDLLDRAMRLLDSGTSLMRKIGVELLGEVLHRSSELHSHVVAILTDFVRSNATEASQKERPEHDVQAALTALGCRPKRPEDTPLDLSATNLSGAVLFGANLRNALLCDSNLSGAFLCGADLSNANLRSADLSHAWLNKIDKRSGSYADILQRMRLVSSSKFRRDGATGLSRTFPRKSLGADLSGANMSSAKLTNAHLLGARVDEDQFLPPEWRRDPRTGLVVRKP